MISDWNRVIEIKIQETVDGTFLVVGGYGSLETEVCQMENQFMICTTRQPELYYYQYYPELFFVDEGYCQ